MSSHVDATDQFPNVTQLKATDAADKTRVYHLNSHKASTVYFNASNTKFKLHCTQWLRTSERTQYASVTNARQGRLWSKI